MLKKIQTRYLELPLAKKLAVGFMGVILSMVFVSTLAINASLTVYEEKLNESQQNQLELFSSQIENVIRDYDRISSRMLADRSVRRLLESLAGEDETEAGERTDAQTVAEAEKKADAQDMTEAGERTDAQAVAEAEKRADAQRGLREELSDRFYEYEHILNLTYLAPDGTVITAGQTVQEMAPERSARVRSTFSGARGTFVLVLPDEEYGYLQGGRQISRRRAGERIWLGDLIFYIDLRGIVESVMYNSSVAPSAFMVSSGGTVLYRSDPSMEEALDAAASLAETSYCVKKIQGEKYFISRAVSPGQKWSYVSMMPYADVAGKTEKIREIVWLVNLIMALCSMLLARKIAQAVTRPLGQLLYSMRIVEKGRFHEAQDQTAEPSSLDEVSALSREFSSMLEAIDHLIIENYEKQLLLQKTRYKLLQAQINPHFLYNTLSTVNWLIRMDRKQEATRVVTGLSDVLRAALSRKDYSNAEEEIEILRHYIDIQGIRFGSRVHFAVFAGENLEKYLLPHFTLQPLVENALLHGADEKDGECTIRARLEEDEEGLAITVEDDGVGMSEERLDEVRSFQAKPQGHGIGLKNIYDRLSILYQEFTFLIESVKGEGTRVLIRIPRTPVLLDMREEGTGNIRAEEDTRKGDTGNIRAEENTRKEEKDG